jgi:hypothetical protein
MSTLRLLALAGVVAALSGCGSSSKPGYCADRGNLQDSVKGLTSVDLRNGGVSSLQSQIGEIESNANALVASAKSDFPSQTEALNSSISALKTDIGTGQVPALIADVSAVTSAVKGFADATSSKC